MIFVADACFSVRGKICDESGRGFGGGLALKPRACKEAIVFLFFLFIDIYLFILFYFYPVYSPTNVAFWLVKDDKSSRFDKN